MVRAICEYGSFSRAAEELYIGQSSLSMAIQRIEAELGMPLFDRRQHPVRLTAAGEEYMQYYRQIMPLQNNMMAKIKDLSDLKTGTVTFGGTHYLLSYILPETIVSFTQRYPGIDLQIVEAQSGEFKDKLMNCEIDFCLKCDATDPKLQTIAHAFFDKLYLAVPRSMVAQKNLGENYLTAEDIREGRDDGYQHNSGSKISKRTDLIGLLTSTFTEASPEAEAVTLMSSILFFSREYTYTSLDIPVSLQKSWSSR